MLCLACIFTIVFCSLLFSFFLDLLFCAIHELKYLQESGLKEWLADFSGDDQHQQYLKWEKASPWKCCRVGQDWSYRFALWDGLPGKSRLCSSHRHTETFSPSLTFSFECSWVLLSHPFNENVNKAAKKAWWGDMDSAPSRILVVSKSVSPALSVGERRGTEVLWQGVALMCFICSVFHNADNTLFCEESRPCF